MLQPGFFDLDNRYKKLNERDPLISLNELIEWEDFRVVLNKLRVKPRRSSAGRKPYDVVLMPEEKVPDAKTIWLFQEHLVQDNLMKELFIDFDIQLDEQGYKAQKGQIVDTSFVYVPKQRNPRDENAQVKAGQIPQRFKDNANVHGGKTLTHAGPGRIRKSTLAVKITPVWITSTSLFVITR